MFRYVNLGFTMNEIDFVELHTRHLDVKFGPTLLASNKFLHLNKVVGRVTVKTVNDDDDDNVEDSVPIIPVKSIKTSVSTTCKKSIASKSGKKKEQSQKTGSSSTTSSTDTTDVAKSVSESCTIATQTAETCFEQEKYADIRNKLLDNTLIRADHFEDEYLENQEYFDAKVEHYLDYVPGQVVPQHLNAESLVNKDKSHDKLKADDNVQAAHFHQDHVPNDHLVDETMQPKQKLHDKHTELRLDRRANKKVDNYKNVCEKVPNKQKKFRCNVCGKIFLSAPELMHHLRKCIKLPV